MDPVPSQLSPNSFQTKVQSHGQEIFQLMEESQTSIFNKDWWYGRIMDWSMKNEHFKTQMFRFVDVLPYLNTGSEVARHLKEYFAENGGELPSVFNFGVGIGSLAPNLLAGAVRKNVTQMAKMFITGETPKEALPVLKKARKNSIAFTVDLLGEATLSEKEASDYQARYLEMIESFQQDAQKWDKIPLLDTDDRGDIPQVNISVKLTSLYSQINDMAWDKTVEILKDRLRPIFTAAVKNFVFINIDMEQYAHKDLTLQVFKELIVESEFAQYRHFGIVIQAYLRDSFQDIKELTQFIKNRGTPITIRLVKGAYWDYETIHAHQKRWPIPVYTNKKESDWNYERCARFLLDNADDIRVAIGSHNVRSIAAAVAYAEELGINPKAIEFQMLYGMADPIKRAMIKKGYRVREYATVGELIPGMAYLVRRLLENTSNESFLRSKFVENTAAELLLKDPGESLEMSDPSHAEDGHFYNHPHLDFALPSHRSRMHQAITNVGQQLGAELYPIIANQEVQTESTLKHYNPSQPQQLVTTIHLATEQIADQAVDAAKTAFVTWSKTPVEVRAKLVEKLAALIERDQYELMATEVYEVGKPWAESDGDIGEAIDFCRYYAKDMRRLGQPQKVGHVMGEVSLYHYWPRGVALVIAPWNFPLAILTGMVAAAAVTGNTVIMKPAEQSSWIAQKLMKLIQEAGFPPGVINFLPGLGETVGAHLVAHKDISLISFTGSRAVGLEILKKSSHIQPGQKSVKKCIIEMGGKNALIIDSDADLDEAVIGVLYSAFGFAGQKCSACSRVIVVDSIYDRFVERLIEAAKSIEALPATDPQAYFGPVVDQQAQQRILTTIEQAKSSSELTFQGSCPTEGYFVPPTIFTNVEPQSQLAQDEIFGPVLAVIRVPSIDEAIQVANNTEYGLTAGIYSRSPAHIERAKNELEAGNVYINRGITGAYVDRHPFGGFKMSGLGSKTGGPDYLIQFMEPRVCSENTMRRGFAPLDDSAY